MGAKWTAFADRDAPEPPDGWLLVWHIYRGVVVERWAERRGTAMYTHWRMIPESGWTATAERLPTAADADYRNCVLGWHRYDGYKVTGWRRFGEDRYLERWTKTPDGPDTQRRD